MLLISSESSLDYSWLLSTLSLSNTLVALRRLVRKSLPMPCFLWELTRHNLFLAYSNLPVAPIVGFFMGGVYGGVTLTAVTLGHTTYWFYATTSQSTSERAQLICWLGYILLTGIIGWSYEATHRESQRLIHKSLKQLDTVNKQLLFTNFEKDGSSNASASISSTATQSSRSVFERKNGKS